MKKNLGDGSAFWGITPWGAICSQAVKKKYRNMTHVLAPVVISHISGYTAEKQDVLIDLLLFCFPGMRFGLMQTKVGIVSLLSRYQFSVTKKTPVPLTFETNSFILSPAGGMWLQIKKRVK
jgi:hypothetical protein